MSLALTHKHEAQPPQNGGTSTNKNPGIFPPRISISSAPRVLIEAPGAAICHSWPVHCPMMGGTKMSITTSFFSLDFWDFLRNIFYQFLTLGIPLSPWPCQEL